MRSAGVGRIINIGSVLGFVLMPYGALYDATKYADWFSEDLTRLFDLLTRNRIKPIIEARMPFTEARRSHELIEQAKVRARLCSQLRKRLTAEPQMA
jgi:NADP-dependent 3-hydroxy acid dehydrogenase YdfG